MSYSLVILPEVFENLAEALREREQLETKRALTAEITAMFDKILQRPRRFPVAYAQVHRALTPRFHFAIFFEILERRAEVVIVGVLHQRRDPALWPKR
jgi:plasmid stabilization system protein ParE